MHAWAHVAVQHTTGSHANARTRLRGLRGLRGCSLPQAQDPQNQYVQAEATAILPERRLVEAQSADGVKFYVNYDKLAICTGSQVRVWMSNARILHSALVHLLHRQPGCAV